jgi:hypothetical protein
MILALNGAEDEFGFADFGAAKSQPVADLQSALKALGNGIRDGVLMKIAVDGIMGPKTAEGANRALTKHLGAGQAPANLRTGLLSQQLITSQIGTITDLIEAEIKRRGFSAPVSKKITTTAAKKTTAKTPDYSKVMAPISPAGLTPSAYTPPAAATAATPVYRVPAAAPASSGGMDSIIKWSAIGVGVVALAGVAYYFATRKKAAPAMAGFAGEGGRGLPFNGRRLFGAGFAGLPHAQIEALEALVDKAGGMDGVVGLLAHIALEKAAHIREN